MSLESVFAVIAGALLLGERMTGRELLGCVIMFAAIVLVQIRGE
jgi:drug/metabolite transporter (DMT)-like permease